MGTVVREISKLAEQRLGLARLLFSFDINPYTYEDCDRSQMRTWKALETAYVDQSGKHLPPLREPMWVLIQAFFPKKILKVMPGIGEIVKATEKALVQAGVITRRDLIESYDLSRKLVSESPRLSIFIFKMPDE